MQSDELVQRAREFGVASFLTAYPGDDFDAAVGELIASPAVMPALLPTLEEMRSVGAAELRDGYIALFDRGAGKASAYETEYGRMRGMSKGNDLADLSGFYRAFGLTLDEEAHEMLDHVSVELEFYGHLLLKEAHLLELGQVEGVTIVGDARAKFLKSHLGAFVPAIAQRVEVRSHPVFSRLFDWCAGLVAAECKRAAVEPAPLDFFADSGLSEEMRCATKSLPIFPE
ncbi:MAG: molecular chaperone TorD family protein [Polyangiaceae bacterium]